MRFFDEKRLTSNSYVYKRVAVTPNLGCPLCRPGRGCNRNRDYSSSWKDSTKVKKQWQRHHKC